MRKRIRKWGFLLPIVLFLTERGLDVSGVNNIALAISLWVVAAGILVLWVLKEGVVLFRRMRFYMEPEEFEKLETSLSQPQTVVLVKEEKCTKGDERWKGFNKAEIAQLSLAWREMRILHGHLDVVGLMDDLKNKKPLNGDCWLCKQPRFARSKNPRLAK